METLIDVMHAPASYFFVLNSSGGEEALPTDGNYEPASDKMKNASEECNI